MALTIMKFRLAPFLGATLALAGACTVARAQFEEASTPVVDKSSGQIFTGNQLYEQRLHKEMLRAYVAGVIDSNGSMLANERWKYCLPAHGTLTQYTDVFVSYLSANPKIRQEPASLLVRESLSEAFGCPGG